MSIKIPNFNADRSIFLFNNIDQDSSEKVISSLIKLAEDGDEDIFLFINSWGGSVLSLNAIIDAIDAIKAPVNTIVFGEADSAAAVLASYKNRGNRYVAKNARLMIHEVSAMAYGTMSELKETVEKIQEIHDKMVEMLAKNTNHSVAEISEMIDGKDFYMSADKAVQLNFSDSIIPSSANEVLETLFDTTIAANGAKRINIKELNINTFNSFASNLKKATTNNFKPKDVSTANDVEPKDDVQVSEQSAGSGESVIKPVSVDTNNETNIEKSLKELKDTSILNNIKKENNMDQLKDTEVKMSNDQFKVLMDRISELTNVNTSMQDKLATIETASKSKEEDLKAKLAEITSKLEVEKKANENHIKTVRASSVSALQEVMGKSIAAEPVNKLIEVMNTYNVDLNVINSLIEVFNKVEPLVSTEVFADGYTKKLSIENCSKDELDVMRPRKN